MANTVTTASMVQAELARLSDEEKAAHSQRFFKTGPGEYGEGDRFRGIRVPVLRKIAKKHRSAISLGETERLLHSPFHEDRFTALVILVEKFKRGGDELPAEIYQLYLRNTEHINNWDLIDISAEHIVGAYLRDRDRSRLYQLASSGDLWERRIAIMATFHFIKHGDFDDTVALAERLLDDPEDLIHKAVGWMLREVGKRDRAVEEAFLEQHYRDMPRMMLRYAIEKFPEDLRQQYLSGEIE